MQEPTTMALDMMTASRVSRAPEHRIRRWPVTGTRPGRGRPLRLRPSQVFACMAGARLCALGLAPARVADAVGYLAQQEDIGSRLTTSERFLVTGPKSGLVADPGSVGTNSRDAWIVLDLL